jgi:co-chaperonin GroES (HSP10)
MVSVDTLRLKSSYIFVIPDEEPDDRQAGSILLPDIVNKESKPRKGTVASIGDAVTRCEKDERVLFSAYGGTEMELAGTKGLLLTDASIIGGI